MIGYAPMVLDRIVLYCPIKGKARVPSSPIAHSILVRRREIAAYHKNYNFDFKQMVARRTRTDARSKRRG